MITPYKKGLTILGATYAPATNRAILIKVNNAGELARSQGKLATVAQALAPATIETKVYEEMAKKLKSSFEKQNVDADVSIVEPSAFVPADGKHIAQDVVLGLGAGAIVLGLGALIWRFVSGRKK